MKKLLLALLTSLLFALNAFAAVNVNTANLNELETIKGIGPVKAQAIIDYRTKNGPFKSIDDLDKVKGIGKKTIDKIRNDVTLSGTTTTNAKSTAGSAAASSGKTADSKSAKSDSKKDAKPDAKSDKKADAKSDKKSDAKDDKKK
jgi:competence protein ComEA